MLVAAQSVPCTKYRLAVVTDATYMDSENVTEIVDDSATPVALAAGVEDEIVGAATSLAQLFAPQVPLAAALKIKSLEVLLVSIPLGALERVR
jgi:hypothetical protein